MANARVAERIYHTLGGENPVRNDEIPAWTE
jgi:hypothetical protein